MENYSVNPSMFIFSGLPKPEGGGRYELLGE